MTWVEVAGTVAGLALWAAFVVFTLLYGWTARWEASPVGRSLFTFSAACALILTLGLVRLLVGDHPAFHVARLALYIAVLSVVVRMTVLLARTQYAARRTRTNHKE